MTIWPRQTPTAMNAFYGDPDPNHDGAADRSWEEANLVNLQPPYPMVLAWATNKPVRTIRIHRLCADSLARVLSGIADHYGSRTALENAGMHLYGGAYNFRLKRGGSSLSNHSWGSAIDLDPARNGFGRRWRPDAGMISPEVVALFAAEGWTWGGKWSTPDAMHFQAANL